MTPFEEELEKINTILSVWEGCKAHFNLTPELIEEGKAILEGLKNDNNPE